MTAEQTARAFGGAARNGRGWVARCCCHEDRRPSLSLCDGDNGELIVHCFANCDYRDILVELRRRGLLRGFFVNPTYARCRDGRSDCHRRLS
jgi:hypothetical protein